MLSLQKLYKTFITQELMEKDIGRITKNPETDIVIRVDDFGGKIGLTIREFVRSERYTGFTKSGTRIPAEHFKEFKDAINSIDENEFAPQEPQEQEKEQQILGSESAPSTEESAPSTEESTGMPDARAESTDMPEEKVM